MPSPLPWPRRDRGEDLDERSPRGPGMDLDRPEHGLVCNVCGAHTRDRHAAEQHRERRHPEAAGGVHHRG